MAEEKSKNQKRNTRFKIGKSTTDRKRAFYVRVRWASRYRRGYHLPQLKTSTSIPSQLSSDDLALSRDESSEKEAEFFRKTISSLLESIDDDASKVINSLKSISSHIEDTANWIQQFNKNQK